VCGERQKWNSRLKSGGGGGGGGGVQWEHVSCG